MRLLLVTHLLLWAGVCQANGAAIDETDRSLTSQDQAQDCSCSDLMYRDYGQCKKGIKAFGGSPFCYVTLPSNCTDLVKIEGKWLSAQACISRVRKSDHCQIGKGADYFGTVGKTKSGLTCQKWTFSSSVFKSLGSHNYCRNPDNDDGVWCYTGGNPTWEFCNVPVCDVTLDPERKYRLIKLSADKLQAEGHGAVQSTVPVQHSNPSFYYFEMTILTGYGPAIGLASHQFNLAHTPGTDADSYGYEASYGWASFCSEWNFHYGDPYYAGDTVGCGFIPGSGELFFTKNGEYQGEAFKVSNPAVELYPTFEINGKVEVNFGNKKFQFEKWVQTKFDDCWSDCGEKGGPCPSFCGSDGYCCRKGYGGCPSGAGEDSPDIHTCFAKIG